MLTYNSVELNISQKQENTWMQYCCILTYNSVALNISLKSRKYLTAILLYLKIQQYCIELFLYIKRIIQCKIVVSSLATVLH